MRGLLKLRYPIEHGSIKSNQDWQDMENIFKYSFNELKANPKEYPVLLTEPVFNPNSQRA